MGQLKFLVIAGFSFSLMACATAQENPNYEYSTKYKTGQDATQMANQTWTNQSQASSQTVLASQSVDRTAPRIYGDGQESIVLANRQAQPEPYQAYTGDVIYADAAQPVPYEASPEPIIEHRLVTSPTDQAYAGQTVQGTPGHGAYIPESIDYDYSQNVVSTNSPIPAPQAYERLDVAPDRSAPILMGNYTVKQGDTVYNLSRRLCVNLDDITLQNGLGQDYGIKIGQVLTLPPSRC
jgi:LysM repeat protein